LELAGSGDLVEQMGSLPAPLTAVAAPEGAVVPHSNGGGAAAAVAVATSSSADGYVAPWIDSASCTGCDECIDINPKIFAYDDKKHAYVKDPKGGPYKDLVRAAEKCTAQVIHPGTPANRNEKDIDKLVARAQKYQ
jgi:pyruvate-ferredoxin/flavodoxin oxidoreductase